MQATALLQAVANKQEAAAQLLLDRGADPNLADSNGWTPLMTAACKDFLPGLRLLIEAKAELNAVHPGSGFTAFHATCPFDYPDCAEALVRAGCEAALTGVRATEHLLNHGLVEAQGEYDIEYESSATRMQKSDEILGVQRAVEVMMPWIEADPN